MSELIIPYYKPTHSETTFVFSIEGSNGAGKTTLLNRFKESNIDTECSLCVPNVFQTAKDMKRFMLFESSALCSALYYLGGAVEMFYRHNESYSKILFDRSVWSTFAAAYARDENILPQLFKCLDVIKDKILLPNLIVVLDVSFETAKLRSKKRITGCEFDKDEKLEFEKKKYFFECLQKSGYQVTFLKTDELSIDEVYIRFCGIVEEYLKKYTLLV